MQAGKRVMYQKSPLAEVVFTLRFPTILTIDSNRPVDFQERLRGRYPNYNEGMERQDKFVFTPDGKVSEFIKKSENKKYTFITEDRFSKVTLTPSTLSISTLKYERWENFRSCICLVIPVLAEIYKPAFCTKVGIQYTNIIVRSKLGLEGKKWNELIEPLALGIMAEGADNEFNSFNTNVEYKKTNENLYTHAHFELVNINGSEERAFVIDYENYTKGNVKVEDVVQRAEALHANSNQFLQRMITETLSNAMGPIDI
ncbi:MAG: TIGR04255 family protein [Prevotella sp.]|nr:TIGR04255 family protein [Prevotella sp.]